MIPVDKLTRDASIPDHTLYITSTPLCDTLRVRFQYDSNG